MINSKSLIDVARFLTPSIVKKPLKKFYHQYLISSFSLNFLDKKMQKYLVKDNGYFIEIGANNGVDQSNTYLLELKKNWKGILVEPSPNKFFECIKNRSSKNKFYCNACVSFDYKEKYVPITYSNLMTISNELETDIENKDKHLKSSIKHLDKNETIIQFGAVAKTLTEILQESNSPKQIDFFSLDVEGAEISVLKGIDFNEYKIEYILVECRNIEKMQKFLTSKNYSLIKKMSNHDYLFSLNL